jgi:hypothetical protein
LKNLTMTPFSKFTFPQAQARRHKALSEVMPVGADLTYFVVLSDAYLNVDEGERHICSFDDLRDVLSREDDLQALQTARANGQLTEGHHGLPDAIAGYLTNAGSGSAHVRRWMFGASEPIIATLAISDIKDAWAGSDFEEIEVGDPSGKWYFRTRDDEPLIFLAVMTGPLLDQMRQCKEFCREVSGEFEYAR